MIIVVDHVAAICAPVVDIWFVLTRKGVVVITARAGVRAFRNRMRDGDGEHVAVLQRYRDVACAFPDSGLARQHWNGGDCVRAAVDDAGEAGHHEDFDRLSRRSSRGCYAPQGCREGKGRPRSGGRRARKRE
jgi:hypothetical protein